MPPTSAPLPDAPPARPEEPHPRGLAGDSRFLLAVLIVALGAAAFAILFRASLTVVYRTLFQAANVLEVHLGLGMAARVIVLTIGGLLAGLVAMRARRSQGVSNVMEAIALGNLHLSLPTTAWRAGASWVAIGSGVSIGREGPLIEFGGSLGQAVADWLRLSVTRRRALVAAGTGAGFAAAYNTPFAAILFVLETLMGIVALEALLPLIAATVISTELTRAVVAGGPIYGSRQFALHSPLELVAYGVLGVAAAAAGEIFKRTLASAEALVRNHPIPRIWCATLAGLGVGVIAAGVPYVAGNGFEALNLVLDGELAVRLMVILIIAKILATSGSVASGIPGGIFTPVLLVGGLVGSLYGGLLAWCGLGPIATPGAYALVGMAATTAATTHAPLTAAVMVFELSGDYPIVLPLLLATFVATALSRRLHGESVYAMELRKKGVTWELTLEGRRVKRPSSAAP